MSNLSQAGEYEFDIDFRQNYWDAIERQQEEVHRVIEKVKLLEEHCLDLKRRTDLPLLVS
jgi:pyruvate-formate lyase